MPNPACGRTEVACGAKPGRKGSPEPKHTRQEGALGIWMGRMTNRNQPETHPARMRAGTHVCSRVSRGGEPSSLLGFAGPGCSSLVATDGQQESSTQRPCSAPTGRRGRTGDRLASTPIVVSSSEPGNPLCRPLRRLGQPASDVAGRGRRSRSSRRAGKPSTWRRAPALKLGSCGITGHDMGNHRAEHP